MLSLFKSSRTSAMALLKSYLLLSMSAKEETVCSFQEIVLAHYGFKPRIAASLSWSYTATSVQAKHRRTSQRLRLVRCRK